MKKVLAIFHAPQEFGDPHILLVSLENGQILETIMVPEGIYGPGRTTSGYATSEYFHPDFVKFLKSKSSSYNIINVIAVGII